MIDTKILENLSDNADGGVWQAMDYYPFGLPMASSYLPGKQCWQFGGKEMDRISGLDLLDFEARPYDPATGRFRQPDPLAEKYHPITPYLYCAANPLKYVDLHGDSIAVLIAPSGAGNMGHMAILIQNSDKRWALYSKNGTDEKSGFSGTPKQDDKGVLTYNSPETFLGSDDNITLEHQYAEAYTIPSNEKEDKIATNTARDIIDENHYNLVSSNCAQLVQETLNAIGRNDGASPVKDILGVAAIISSPSLLFGFAVSSPLLYSSRSPNEIYKRIKKENKGITVHAKQKKKK